MLSEEEDREFHREGTGWIIAGIATTLALCVFIVVASQHPFSWRSLVAVAVGLLLFGGCAWQSDRRYKYWMKRIKES